MKQLRDAEVVSRFNALTHFQRASARIVRSLMTDHRYVCEYACALRAAARRLSLMLLTTCTRSTFATFLDTDGYIQRWQRFMLLVTLVLSTLLTSIWFYCASQCASAAFATER